MDCPNMTEKVDIKKSLRVFNQIATKGRRVGDEYLLNGLIRAVGPCGGLRSGAQQL